MKIRLQRVKEYISNVKECIKLKRYGTTGNSGWSMHDIKTWGEEIKQRR